MSASLARREHRSPPRATSPPQYAPYAPQLGYISESIHRLLNERECAIFDRGLADYHRRRNIQSFVECLSLVLNTNQKRQLLIPVRDTYVKPSDFARFNQLVQARGLATSLRKKKKDEDKSKSGEGLHKVEVKKDSNGEWGFNIRGGSEYGLGIFISWVDPGSNAEKSGLRVGDQIYKAADTSFESITHHNAVEVLKSNKRLRMFVVSHGRVPGSRLANKVYRWVDCDGQPTTPPSDPYEITSQMQGQKMISEADERKVTVMVPGGQELGVSIRGGSEHGLGIYISAVEEGSVAETYGLKVGDQILEVNGVNFIGIVHGDAANALRAQPSMVMRLKDVGKLPHSRITTHGKTDWHSTTSTIPKTRSPNQGAPPPSVFTPGAGTQLMLRTQDPAIKGRGIMDDVARSVLSTQELATFNYYLDQYEHKGLPIEDLVTPLLDLFDTAEKLQVLSELRAIVRPRDQQLFNELTIHKLISIKKQNQTQDSRDGSFSSMPRNPAHTMAEVHTEQPHAFQLSHPHTADMSLGSGERTLTPGEDGGGLFDDTGRDKVPQKLSPDLRGRLPVFHTPPPPSTSTPDGGPPSPQTALANSLKDRRQRINDTSQGQWPESSFSTIQNHSMRALDEADSPAIAQLEEKIRMETEQKLRQQFEREQQRLLEEQQQHFEQEQREKETTLRRERDVLEQQMKEREEQLKQELQQQLRHEAQEEARRQLEEEERRLAAEHARQLEEERERQRGAEEEAIARQLREVEEKTKMELEEKIWKEAEENMRHEFEATLQKQRKEIESQAEQLKQRPQLNRHLMQDTQNTLRRELEQKYKREYEEKMRLELQKKQKELDEERQKRAQDESAKRREEIDRLEAEEQARIELEERIRREAEAKARAEYGEKLQKETEERARLAEEIKAHKAAEERLEREKEEAKAEQTRARRERTAPPPTVAATTAATAASRKQQQQQQVFHVPPPPPPEPEAQEEEEEGEDEADGFPDVGHELFPGDQDQQFMIEEQRRRRLAEEREEQRLQEEQERAANSERDRTEAEQRKKKELERKREENLRRREEERKRKEEEERQKRMEGVVLRRPRPTGAQKQQQPPPQQQQRQPQQQQQTNEIQKQKDDESLRRKKKKEEDSLRRKQRESERAATMDAKKVKVNFGDGEQQDKRTSATKQQAIEAERREAEEKLQRRIKQQAKKRQKTEPSTPPASVNLNGFEIPLPPSSIEQQQPAQAPPSAPGISYAGYDNLHGKILQVKVKKVCKKLGIAIDGGANTKQKAVIIREISPGGCAAQTGRGLVLGQQILEVDGSSLHGLRHREVVMAVKESFEGPLNKILTLTVLHTQQ